MNILCRGNLEESNYSSNFRSNNDSEPVQPRIKADRPNPPHVNGMQMNHVFLKMGLKVALNLRGMCVRLSLHRYDTCHEDGVFMNVRHWQVSSSQLCHF